VSRRPRGDFRSGSLAVVIEPTDEDLFDDDDDDLDYLG
jgi:hypothetical protein